MKIKRQLLALGTILLASFFALAGANFASAAGLVPCGGVSDPCTLCHLIIGIHNLVTYGLKVLLVFSLLGIFISGVIYLISAGNTGLMETAKKALTASLIGFAIALAAWLMINIVMNLLAKTDLGIGKSNWYTFSCSTQSSALTGNDPPGPGPNQQQCCIKSTNESDPNYGKKENCPDATPGKTKAECEDYWKKYYPDPKDAEKLKAELAKCTDTPASCPDGGGTLGSCSDAACVGKSGPNPTCAPTNNGCGGLGGNQNGCNNTSPALASALGCLRGKGITVSSITLNAHSDWCEKCVNSYAGVGYCKHSQGSCHFGGTKCQGTSSAADLLPATDSTAIAAKNCNVFDTILFNNREWVSNTYRSNIGHTTHVHVSVDNAACGCDWKKEK